MAKAQPLGQNEAISIELNKFAETIGHTDSFDKFAFRRLLKLCDEQQAHDVANASLNRAFLCSTTGEFEEAERWIVNAERNGAISKARLARFTHLVNHGFATRALSCVEASFTDRAGEDLSFIADRAAAIGAFNAIASAMDRAYGNNEIVKVTNLLPLSKRAADVYKKLGVTDPDVSAMVDVAGEIMRENKLLWLDRLPNFTVSEEHGLSVGIEFKLDVSPHDAVKLGWQLTERIVERGLDRSGVYVDFLGMAEATQEAA